MRPTPNALQGPKPRNRILVAGLAATFCLLSALDVQASERRRNPIVEAVAAARPAIVNIHGQKTIREQGSLDRTKHVNGMGTGVVIDERGYIITNHHVIEGVHQIRVTMASGDTFVARLIARDPQTDLAIIKISTGRSLPLIEIGTSQDLMPGESVIAVGNAYGYHHTVTRGIISALNRAVEVTDAQKYYDLIQTDASINPGNSGGPLLNVDGAMIGINVAVRVGAQGIGFAIPVDKAMDVAARLISTEKLTGARHGIEGSAQVLNGVQRFVVSNVSRNSPAAVAGIEPGDIVTAIEDTSVNRQLDIERAMLGLKSGSYVAVSVQRRSDSKTYDLHLDSVSRATLANATSPANSIATDVWRKLGVRVQAVPATSLPSSDYDYNGGLRVTDLRRGSISERNGIRTGDIIVGMHIWETISLDNLDYVLNRAQLKEDQLRLQFIRDAVTYEGHLPTNWR